MATKKPQIPRAEEIILLERQVHDITARNIALVTERDRLQTEKYTDHNRITGLVGDLGNARTQLEKARYDLARAHGYIDRIRDEAVNKGRLRWAPKDLQDNTNSPTLTDAILSGQPLRR